MARWILPGGFLIVWAIRHVWGCSSWRSSVPTLVPEPFWLALALAYCLIASFKQFDRFKLPAIATLLLALAINEPQIRLPGPKTGIKVMQLNMQHGLGGVDSVAALIEREHPDVLFLQEAGSLDKPWAQVTPALRKALEGYEIHRVRYEAIAVRGEILERSTIDTGYGLDGRRKVIATALARVAGKTISLATLHFQPTQEDKLFAAPSAAYRRLVMVGEIRRTSYRVLADWLRSQPKGRPCIVGGDFNEHPCGPNYRLLGTVAQDAWVAAGVGFGLTIPSSSPFERIDYIGSETPTSIALRCCPKSCRTTSQWWLGSKPLSERIVRLQCPRGYRGIRRVRPWRVKLVECVRSGLT